MGSLSLLQGIFLTQKSNQGLLYCRQILYKLSYQGGLKFRHLVGHGGEGGERGWGHIKKKKTQKVMYKSEYLLRLREEIRTKCKI